MKTVIFGILGLLLIVCSVFVGLYLGIWVMFIGGIAALIADAKAINVIPLNIAIDIARIVFASVIGFGGFFICFFFGIGSITYALKN